MYDDIRDHLEDWRTDKGLEEQLAAPSVGSMCFYPTKGKKVFHVVGKTVSIHGELIDSTDDFIMVDRMQPAGTRIVLIRKDKITMIEEVS